MKYFRKIEGDELYLSPMSADDAQTYTRWLSDTRVTDGLGSTCRVFTVAQERNWIENRSGDYQFAIIRKNDDCLLGNIGFDTVDSDHQRAEVGLFIGEEENRGHGYGAQALRLILDYGFRQLNLRNVMLKLFSFNERAFACYKRVGFREIGRRRQSYYVNGMFYDEIYMDILREEFLSQD
jgi:RimJ/RimL family protein N-acetyltransferase